MKNSTLKIVFVFFLTLGMTTVNAQDKAKQISNNNASSKEIKKVKDQKSDFDEKVDAKSGSFSETAKDLKDKQEQVKGDAVDKKDNVEKKMEILKSSYSKRIRATKDPKEQERLKEELEVKMKELKASSPNTGKDDVSISGSNSSNSSTGAVKPKETSKGDVQVNKGKPTVAVKNEKVSSVKANISNRRKSLDNRKAMIDNANAKVDAAKAKLDVAKKEGTLTTEEIAAKEAKIAKAEAQIKKLEASIEKAEKKFDENDSKLSDFGKDKEN